MKKNIKNFRIKHHDFVDRKHADRIAKNAEKLANFCSPAEESFEHTNSSQFSMITPQNKRIS